MKKIIACLGILIGATVGLRAEQFATPTGAQQALASSDYGGVYSSASLFSSQTSTVVAEGEDGVQGAFHGVIFSSGLCTDFVDVFDSTSSPVSVAQRNDARIARLYNVSGSTTGAAGVSNGCSGWSGTPYPLRFRKGLRTQPSSDGYNCITTLFYYKRD